jgi:hypothetical protein
VRFIDFLRATVMLSAGSATLLAVVTVIGVSRELEPLVIYVALAWWVIATGIGVGMGRRAETTPPIAKLLAGARSQSSLPELQPGVTLLNRLWPLLVLTVGAAALAFFEPQVAAVGTGFGIIWALAWRRQHDAVAAIEERDAVRFYVDRTSPLKPMRLVRTPGFGGDFLQVDGRP